jgi:hypothetical protein
MVDHSRVRQTTERRDRTPLVIRVFYGVISLMAITGLAIAVPVTIRALIHIPQAPGSALNKVLIAGFVVCVGTGLVAGSLGTWLAAHPHKDSTMRRLRRIGLCAWLIGMCIGILLILT